MCPSPLALFHSLLSKLLKILFLQTSFYMCAMLLIERSWLYLTGTEHPVDFISETLCVEASPGSSLNFPCDLERVISSLYLFIVICPFKLISAYPTFLTGLLGSSKDTYTAQHL